MKKLYLLTVLGMLTALAPVVNNMFSPAMPDMVTAFETEQASVQLGLTAAMLGLAVGQLFVGPLSDRWGRHLPLLGSMLVLVVTSLGCTLAPSISAFIALRLVQGMAAGGGIVIARSVASDVSQGVDLLKTLAFVNVFNGLVPIITPMLGGGLAIWMGWRGPVLGMLVVAVMLMAACWRLPESLPVARRVAHDLSGMVILYKEVLRNRPCICTILHQGTALAILFGNIALTPFLVTHYGYSPAVIGYALGVNGVFTAIGAGVAAGMGSGERGMRVAAGGLLGCSVAMVILLMVTPTFWAYEGCVCLMLFFVGVTLTGSSGYAMDCARARAGTASALLGAVGFVAGAIVSPLMGLGGLPISASIVYLIASLLSALFAMMAVPKKVSKCGVIN